MKHILKRLHFGGGGGHEPSPASSSSASESGSRVPATAGTCGSDHRMAEAMERAAEEREQRDYFSSEEEYQMQLAMTISASNSEFKEDPHNDQIRAATLLSLGKHREGTVDGAAESLARRYWDYNVLDYDEKVVDGFYDIFALSTSAAGQGKMPSLSDLETSTGDLGFEVILVNRSLDWALLELEQVAQCISLDCPRAEIGVLVQRIAELVTQHMGGPVTDANDMLTRWMEKSITMRTSLQTSILPIGAVNIGLSRHRALLFKVLADKVGVPCKLVKGSHYTGIDDDAVNIIKVDNEGEFLVDLMAAPGILIPADVLSAKDSSSLNSRINKNSTPWATESSVGLSETPKEVDDIGGDEKAAQQKHGMFDKNARFEKVIQSSPFPSSNRESLPSTSGSCSPDDRNYSPLDSESKGTSLAGCTAGQKRNVDMSVNDDSLKDKVEASSCSPANDPKDLFSDLNPFQMAGTHKVPQQLQTTEKKINGFQRRRENISSGPGRPPLPLVWKNRSACNEVPINRANNFSKGLPRRNKQANDFNAVPSSSSSTSASPGQIYHELSKVNVPQVSGTSYALGVTNALNEPTGVGFTNYYTGPDDGRLDSRTNQHALSASDMEYGREYKPFVPLPLQTSENKSHELDERHKMVSQIATISEQSYGRNVNDKQERRKPHDRSTGTSISMKDSGSSTATRSKPDRLGPMLDDVAELEILWEELVIGERIGLGSYGEVYLADWKGTEVAVKKFLDQDFYGDALDEFRSEVRIMRRLRHPNVVLFLGAVTRHPNLSIVTEFLPRGSLYKILHRPNCQIDEKRRIKMAIDVAKGMNCLHTSSPTVVHRDLKSPNLLVDKNWNVKVCDFGLSRLKHSTFLSSKSTAGTPEWMAPEVLRNEQSNEKCDVYSFGVILWELATLKMPWSGMNPMQVVGAVGFQNRRLEIPKELDPLVARIIWECWQTDPNLRPSFAQLTTALKSLQQLAIPTHEDVHNSSSPMEISVYSIP